ncbi:MAG: hypothetical protein ACRC8S_20875 [Fimbriiglobus sp.]
MRLRGFWVATEQPDGRTQFARSFGRPRTLDANERLWVVFDVTGDVSVNGVPLGTGQEFDLTAHLLPRNRLEITLEAASLDQATLEVRQVESLG